MDARFSFTVDPDRDLIRVQLAGFFTAPSIEAFIAARRCALAQLRCPTHRHLALIDIAAMSVQSQDTVEAFGAILADPRARSRRIAFVTAASLARTQLRRALGARPAACFSTAAEAERWLFAAAEACAA